MIRSSTTRCARTSSRRDPSSAARPRPRGAGTEPRAPTTARSASAASSARAPEEGMNDLLRDLAPISDSAWKEIDSQAQQALVVELAARKLVDFVGPKGWQES